MMAVKIVKNDGSKKSQWKLVELELRAMRAMYARGNARRVKFDIWLKSALSRVHHTQRDTK